MRSPCSWKGVFVVIVLFAFGCVLTFGCGDASARSGDAFERSQRTEEADRWAETTTTRATTATTPATTTTTTTTDPTTTITTTTPATTTTTTPATTTTTTPATTTTTPATTTTTTPTTTITPTTTTSTTTTTPATATTATTGNQTSQSFVPVWAGYYVNAFPSAQEQPLSLYSLLDVNRISYLDDQGNSAWAKLKSLNPAIQIYAYEDSNHTYSSQDNLTNYPSPVGLNTIARYDQPRPPSNPYPVGNLDQNNPGFFLLDANGNRITDTVYGFYYLDQGNPAFATFWVESVYSDIVTQPWKADGIFVDGPYFAVPSLSANSAKYPTDAAWATASLTFMQVVTTGLHGYGQKVWFNAGNTGTSTGQSSWEIADAWADPPDVLMDEGAFAVKWGCSGSVSTINVVSVGAPGSNYQVGDVLTITQSGASGGKVTVSSIGSGGTVAGMSLTAQGTGYSAASALSVSGGHGSGCTVDVGVGYCMVQIYPEAQCKSSIDTMQGVSHVRAAIESHCLGSPGSSGLDNYGNPLTYWDAVYFALSCFLLGKNTVANNSYFYWWDTALPASSGLLWLNEYGINLGSAVGTYQVTPYGSSNVYWRQFQNGYVYVNLSNNDVNGIVLPASFRQVTHSNVQNPFGDPTINTLNLPAHRAAILLNSSVTSW